MIIEYFIHLFILIGIYLILTLSLQLSVGFTGLLNLGHVAFFAIGAYTAALLTLNGVPFLIAFLAAGIIAMIFGFILVKIFSMPLLIQFLQYYSNSFKLARICIYVSAILYLILMCWWIYMLF